MPPRREGTDGLIEVADGIRRLTAPNPSPLTADGTNTFVLGAGEVVVVDPGPMQNGGHIERLIAGLAGERVVGIALTHRHEDHRGATVELSLQTGAEVLSISRLAERGIDRIEAAGHTSDHVVFRFGDCLLTGDHIFENTSTMIDWPDGNLGAFLDTTRAMLGFAHLNFLPAHGPPLSDPAGRLSWLIRHREARNAAILEALAEGPAHVDAIFAHAYADAPRNLRDSASRNLSAHLNYLKANGTITSEGAGPEVKFILSSAD